MKLIQEINILESKKLAIVLNLLAIPLLAIFIYFFTWICAILKWEFVEKEYNMMALVYFLIIYTILIVIHEMIHGVFFKLYKPENKVKFGIKWKQGMAYATSPGSLYNRGQMLVISLAPFVLVSLALTILTGLGVWSAMSYVFIAAIHAASCVGDFYYAYLLVIKHRNVNLLAEDTETGLLIYQA